MKKIGILTLGCRVNQYESQAISEQLEAMGYSIVPFSDECDVYIINTCTVTAESDRKSKQMIGRALARKKENPSVIVCVIGCFTQNRKQNNKTEDLFFGGEIDILGGNSEKSLIAATIDSYIKSNRSYNVDLLEDMCNVREFDDLSVSKSNNVRAYLKVQDGCNNFCTYCIVPIVRGRIRSKPIEHVICDLYKLRSCGYDEVVFCGIEISAYCDENGNGLVELAKAAREANFRRVRFGSLNPTVMDENLLSKLSKIDCIMPHFHLSVQSASSAVLKRMGRKYDAAGLQSGIDTIRKYFPDVTLSCDIICGFPGETEEDFMQTVNFVRENNILHAHIFPYSRREGTPAASAYGQLSTKIKKQRCAFLTEVSSETKRAVFTRHIGKSATVLIENKKDGYWFGHTENFMPVAIREECTPGEFRQVILSDRFEKISDELSVII